MTITGEEHSAGEGRRQDMQRLPKPAPAGAGPDSLAGGGWGGPTRRGRWHGQGGPGDTA